MLAEAQIKTTKFNCFFFNLETAEPENREKSSNPSGKEACVNAYRGLQNQFFLILLETAEPENRETAKEHVCMQHIETDQFAQSRVIVVVSPAQAASVFCSHSAVL